jgi:VanZ family protein
MEKINTMNIKFIPKIILYIIFFTCLLFLFINGPTAESPRSYLKLWDLGHLLLFFIGGILFLTDFRKFFKDNFFYHLIIFFIFSLVVGVLTELIQVRFHRNPDTGDLIRDIIGGFTAVVFFSPRRWDIPKRWLKMLKVSVIIMLLLEAYPVSRALLDEWVVREQFPLLSDFETPFELDRWHHEQPLQIDTKIARHGARSMRVHLTRSKYSTVSMRYFPGDWSGYRSVQFSINNAGNDTLTLVFRVNDHRHYALGQHYNNRYNRRLQLAPGWNDFSIPIVDIMNAPTSRKMDITSIDLICFFSMELPAPRVINIDYLHLSDPIDLPADRQRPDR